MSKVTLADMQARERFTGDVTMNACAFAIEGQDGLVGVDSQQNEGQTSTLLWSQREFAARWAATHAAQGQVIRLSLTELLQRRLDELSQRDRHVAVNWSGQGDEPELAAADLDQQIRQQMIHQFVTTVNKGRAAWVLKFGDTPITFPGRDNTVEVLPVFQDRAAAECAIASSWNHATAARVPLADFLSRAVNWCAETRRKMAPAYIPGRGAIEHHSWEVKAMISGHIPIRQVA
jgi:uncharacterized protein DUF2750